MANYTHQSTRLSDACELGAEETYYQGGFITMRILQGTTPQLIISERCAVVLEMLSSSPRIAQISRVAMGVGSLGVLQPMKADWGGLALEDVYTEGDVLVVL